MPPQDDPIRFLLEANISDMTDEELDAYVTKTHTIANEPRALSKMLTGKVRKKKAPSAKSAAAKAAQAALFDSL